VIEEGKRLLLEYRDRDAHQVLELSAGGWRSAMVDEPVAPCAAASRIELTEADGLELDRLAWSGPASDLVGLILAPSDVIDAEYCVTVNDEDWEWLYLKEDNDFVVLTPDRDQLEQIAEIRWFSEGGVTSSFQLCQLFRYGVWLIDTSINDDGMDQGVDFSKVEAAPGPRHQDIADWIESCDLAPGRGGDLEWEGLNLKIGLTAGDQETIDAVMSVLPKAPMPGWTINDVTYFWDESEHRWRSATQADWDAKYP
jgi:hypothetical protein